MVLQVIFVANVLSLIYGIYCIFDNLSEDDD